VGFAVHASTTLDRLQPGPSQQRPETTDVAQHGTLGHTDEPDLALAYAGDAVAAGRHAIEALGDAAPAREIRQRRLDGRRHQPHATAIEDGADVVAAAVDAVAEQIAPGRTRRDGAC